MDARETLFLKVMEELRKAKTSQQGAHILTSVFKHELKELGLNGKVSAWDVLSIEYSLPELWWALHLIGLGYVDYSFITRMAQLIGRLETILLLIETGIGLNNMVNFRQNQVLLEAAYQGRCACTKVLIEDGADVNTMDEDHDTPLILAACNGFDKVVSLLIEKGANVNAANNYGSTALMYACDGNFDKVVQLLLSAGAGVNVVERDGGTPLLWAAYGGSANCVQMLLSKGANVNASDNHGYTALFSAAMHGNEACTELLLRAGANVNAETVEDETALIAAAAAGSLPVVTKLLSAGACVNHINIYSQTALTCHVARCDPVNHELAMTLVKAGGFLIVTDSIFVEKYIDETNMISYAKVPAFLQYDDTCRIIRLDTRESEDETEGSGAKETGEQNVQAAGVNTQITKDSTAKTDVKKEDTVKSYRGKSHKGASVKKSKSTDDQEHSVTETNVSKEDTAKSSHGKSHKGAGVKKSKSSSSNQEHVKKSEKKVTEPKTAAPSQEICSATKSKGTRKRKRETTKKPELPHISEETIEMKDKPSQPSTSGAAVKTKDVIETLEKAKDDDDSKKEEPPSSCSCIII